MDEPVKDKMSGRSRALGQLMLGHNLDRERERERPASQLGVGGIWSGHLGGGLWWHKVAWETNKEGAWEERYGVRGAGGSPRAAGTGTVETEKGHRVS